MAVDMFAITGDIRAAFIAGGALPASPLLIPLCAGLAQAWVNAIHSAEVHPETGVPPMTSPSGAVTGKGKIT